MAEHQVWGFTVQRSPSGKRIWPNGLKREATRRIREEGLSTGEVAAEIGAHECLVRKWWVADRRSRGEKISVERPAFAEVTVEETRLRPATEHRGTTSGLARLHSGSLCFEFPVDIAEKDLMKLVRVAGQVS